MGMVAPQQPTASARAVRPGRYSEVSWLASQRGVCRQWLYRESVWVLATPEEKPWRQEVADLQQQGTGDTRVTVEETARFRPHFRQAPRRLASTGMPLSKASTATHAKDSSQAGVSSRNHPEKPVALAPPAAMEDYVTMPAPSEGQVAHVLTFPSPKR